MAAGGDQHLAHRAVVRHRVEGRRDAAEIEAALRIGMEHAAQVHLVAFLRVVQPVGAAFPDVELGAGDRAALRVLSVQRAVRHEAVPAAHADAELVGEAAHGL